MGVRVDVHEELKFFAKIQNIFFLGGGVGVGLGGGRGGGGQGGCERRIEGFAKIKKKKNWGGGGSGSGWRGSGWM